jgi:CRISPR/Cas system CSM-associated protein Csm2 small subunit
MNIDVKQIMTTFLRMIHHISDREYQKRIWILGLGPECDSFTETVCNFFDFADPILANHKRYNISEDQYQLLLKFHDEFRRVSEKYEVPQEFIDTPDWDKVRAMAQEVLKAFHYNEQQDLGGVLHDIAQILTNKHRQRIWVFAERSEQDKTEQAIRNFFNHFQAIVARRENFTITPEQYDLLVKFHTKLKAFTTEDDPSSETTRWAEIQNLGRTILQAFNSYLQQNNNL